MSKLTRITNEAKRIRKAHPNKYSRLSNPWAQGYIKEAAKNIERGKTTKPAKKKKAAPRKKRPAVPRKTTVRKKHRKWGTVRAHQRRVKGKPRTRRVGAKAVVRRSRGVGRKGPSTGLMIGLGALAIGAVYLLSKSSSPQQQYQNLPPIQQTGNQVRDDKTTSVIQWAMAAGLAINAISALIDKLNKSSDQQVDSIYQDVATGGDISNYV